MPKAVTLQSKTTYVSPFDAAVDHEKAKEQGLDWAGYGKRMLTESGSWREMIPLKTGVQPCVFHIGVVDPEELNRIEDECEVSGKSPRRAEAHWRCFLNGLRDIENWGEDVPKIKRSGVEYVDPTWLRRNFVMGQRKVAIEVGSIIWSFNNLTEDDVKK